MTPQEQPAYPTLRPILQRKEPGPMERCWVLDLRQRICKLSLENLEVPESKQVLQKNRGVVSNRHKSQLKNPQWPKLDQFEQQNKVELDYNPKYKYLCIHSATKQLTYSTDQSTEKRQITHVKKFQVIYVDVHPQGDGA